MKTQLKKNDSGEYISNFFSPFSKERSELRKQWSQREDKNISWQDFLNSNILEAENSKYDNSYPAKAVCVTCGTASARDLDGYCVNGHDNWLELSDKKEHPSLWNAVKRKSGVRDAIIERHISYSKNLKLN